VKIDWDDGSVTAAWDGSRDDADRVLVLAHGAGGDMTDAILTGVAKELASHGTAVLRFNFPYREAGRKAPGAQTQSEACYRAVADVARKNGAPLYLGGKSYGGRMASHIVADGYAADGLVFLSYPLHAPGRFDKLRDEHLRTITTPMLFVQGTRDTFARPDLLEQTLASLPTATHVPIENGDHGLKVPHRTTADVVMQIASAIRTFVR
jgi:predicted alpha/beta-hydrolase family hydrolase